MTSIVICGLVRDEDRLRAKIRLYHEWLKNGHILDIVYSTWIGEVDRYPGLREYLSQLSVKIIEIEEPKLILKGGHQLHQMLAMHYGLEAALGTYVLKTRVDLCDDSDAMLGPFRLGTNPANDFLNVGIANKILIETARLELPFLCTDAQFFGKKADLMRLVSLSAEFELLYNNMAVEQCFFFNPFRELGIFKTHFYWNLPHFSEINKQRFEQYQEIISSEILLNVMIAWWVILDQYFQIGWQQKTVAEDDFNSILEAFELDGEDKWISKGDGSGVIQNSAFVSKLIAIIGDSRIEEVKSAIHSYNRISPVSIPQYLFDYYESYRERFSKIETPKACSEGVSIKKIKGAAQHFFVKDDNDKASTRYHEQITYLRREIDVLQHQLSGALEQTLLHRFLILTVPRRVREFLAKQAPILTRFYSKNLMKKNKNGA